MMISERSWLLMQKKNQKSTVSMSQCIALNLVYCTWIQSVKKCFFCKVWLLTECRIKAYQKKERWLEKREEKRRKNRRDDYCLQTSLGKGLQGTIIDLPFRTLTFLCCTVKVFVIDLRKCSNHLIWDVSVRQNHKKWKQRKDLKYLS